MDQRSSNGSDWPFGPLYEAYERLRGQIDTDRVMVEDQEAIDEAEDDPGEEDPGFSLDELLGLGE